MMSRLVFRNSRGSAMLISNVNNDPLGGIRFDNEEFMMSCVTTPSTVISYPLHGITRGLKTRRTAACTPVCEGTHRPITLGRGARGGGSRGHTYPPGVSAYPLTTDTDLRSPPGEPL